jgi:heptosyltransferase-2
MNKILISRTDGVGDLLLTTPLIHEVKAKYPEAKLTVLVSKYAGELLLNNPDVDGVIAYDKNDPKSLLSKLRSEKFDAVIAAYPRPGLAWHFFMAGIPQRYGTASRWYSIFYNKPVWMSRKKSEKSEADYNIMSAGRLLDGARAIKEYYYITEEEKQKGLEYLRLKGLSPGFIIIHPGSRGSAWNLSEAAYAKLTNELLNNGYTVLLTGGSPEKCMLFRIKDYAVQVGKPVIMEEELSLREFAGVISHAAVLISGSTGPMHIAAALGVKTLSFFPPDIAAAMKPKRWAPLGNKQAIIQPDSKLPKVRAMDSIGTELILSKLKELMAK